MKKVWIVGLLLFLPLFSKAQESGNAGFSPLFAPQFKAELPEEVNETSGLFFHKGRLWTHNDSGGKPILYGLDTVSFKTVQKITFANVKNKDWEDVCTDGETVFVGDCGNNKGNRKNLKIYTFPLSAIPDVGDVTIKVDSICFTFGDQQISRSARYTILIAKPFSPPKIIFICLVRAGKRAPRGFIASRKHQDNKSLRWSMVSIRKG